MSLIKAQGVKRGKALGTGTFGPRSRRSKRIMTNQRQRKMSMKRRR